MKGGRELSKGELLDVYKRQVYSMRNAFYAGISHTFYRYFNEKTAISPSFFNDLSYSCPVFILHFSYISHDDCIDDGC